MVPAITAYEIAPLTASTETIPVARTDRPMRGTTSRRRTRSATTSHEHALRRDSRRATNL